MMLMLTRCVSWCFYENSDDENGDDYNDDDNDNDDDDDDNHGDNDDDGPPGGSWHQAELPGSPTPSGAITDPQTPIPCFIEMISMGALMMMIMTIIIFMIEDDDDDNTVCRHNWPSNSHSLCYWDDYDVPGFIEMIMKMLMVVIINWWRSLTQTPILKI